MKLLRKFLLIGVVLCRSFLWAQDDQSLPPIFVQASSGSFNHQALVLLLPDFERSRKVQFCGSPRNVMQSAALGRGVAFVAIRNTCVPGNIVAATLEALREFQILKIIASIDMKIEMALLRHRDAIGPITRIASHPAALQQISRWKKRQGNLLEISIPGGTSEAARRLSNGDLASDVAVIGSKNLACLYPKLVVAEERIQDLENNYTTFILIEVVKREHIITESEAMEEIDRLFHF